MTEKTSDEKNNMAKTVLCSSLASVYRENNRGNSTGHIANRLLQCIFKFISSDRYVH
jgi:hypothetical protein